MKSINKLLEEIEQLNKAHEKLKQELLESNKSTDAIKTGTIDALVLEDKNELKVYTDAASDKTYRILIERMNEGAVTLSKTGIILYCNQSFSNMVNLPLQKVIGSEFKNFIEAPSRESFDMLLKLADEENTKEQLNLNSHEGKLIPVLMSVNALTVDNKLLLNLIITDLTIPNRNQKKLKLSTARLVKKTDELEIANIDLESFNYISSHDLQEPLRKIQIFVSIIIEEEKNNLSSIGKKYFHRMQDTVKRMQMLIDDLHKYSRAKNTSYKFEKVDLNSIIREVKEDYEISIKKHHAAVISKDLCKVNGIRFQLFQLFHNLLGNSLKFAKPQQPLRVTIKSKTGKGKTFKNEQLLPDINYCHISFSDNGIGFDPKYKNRIFEVFQRLSNTVDPSGTGIGLSICKRIVDNHKGVITATGKTNKGVTFDIYLTS
ncbi:MAG: domain S-box protein [Bacteroidota bacterium]|jgi:PAS domain S-box-containing protein|nr:domain S-box protein [Bacteroidota bacterium]